MLLLHIPRIFHQLNDNKVFVLFDLRLLNKTNRFYIAFTNEVKKTSILSEWLFDKRIRQVCKLLLLFVYTTIKMIKSKQKQQ